ncbi:extracellular solute-binding protein [Kribbella ginsengisoli]|uniref:Extracellular solute-binding protein n=1 Tax=Kribbella ginsengisoli TaxID=363865 RepID=A0ABP6Z463_9ACTN
MRLRFTPMVAMALTATTLLLASSCTKDDGAAASNSAKVKVLLIGFPDQDGIDPVTGADTPGIGELKKRFNDTHSDIKLEIVNIPWGEGATGYAPKTEAMMKAGEACLYQMPGAPAYARKGQLVDLDEMIKKDPEFKNIWGSQLDAARSWGPSNPEGLWYLPANADERVIHWDSKLFKDFGVEPLSSTPTLDEIEQKAARLTGKNPVTGEQNYGYWYQGKYAVWQFLAIAHTLGASWGGVTDSGALEVNWNTPEYLKALEWFAKMSKYAPKGALASEGMPQGFLSDKNIVALIPEGEPGYFLKQMIAQPKLSDRFRTTINLKGSDGLGGVNNVQPLAMAASCPSKDAAWTVQKWLAGDPASQKYYFDAVGRLPLIEGSESLVSKVAEMPDGKAILSQPRTAEPLYPWAADQPRWALQTALEAALSGTLSPKAALEKAQKETAKWLSEQGTK